MKPLTKKIKTHLYPVDAFIVSTGEDLDDFIFECYDTDCHPDATAITLQYAGDVHIVYSDSVMPSEICHESIHAANKILDKIGVWPHHSNDEAQAYLAGYIFKETYKFLNKHNRIKEEV